MDWGMHNRLSRILKPETGRTVMLAIDHGYFLGPTSGLERPGETVKDLLPYADSLMLTRGTLRQCIPADSNVPIVLRVSGGTSILGELSREGLTVVMEDAIRLNASAVTLSVFVGAEGERTTLLNLAKLIDEGQKYGVPVLAVTAVGKEMTRDARYLGLACRISAEIGAHMVKTYFCEGFEEVVASTPVPIVIAGGKKVSEKEAVQLAYNAVRAGARGVDMGRNIFQSDCPVGMIRAVRAVVHDGAGVDEAFGLYRQVKEEALAGRGLPQQ
jgi:putative autoinducer-2 (AI-2) aldolase